MFCVVIFCKFKKYFIIAFIDIIGNYNNYKTNYFKHITEFLNNFVLGKNDNTKSLNII